MAEGSQMETEERRDVVRGFGERRGERVSAGGGKGEGRRVERIE